MPTLTSSAPRLWFPAAMLALAGSGLLYWFATVSAEPPTNRGGAEVQVTAGRASAPTVDSTAPSLPGQPFSSTAIPTGGAASARQAWADIRQALSSNGSYATYIRLSSAADAASQAAARTLLETCRIALFNTFSDPQQKTYDNAFQMRAPAPLVGEDGTLAAQRRHAWDLVQMRCRPMFDDPSWEKMLQSPQRADAAQDAAARKEALRLDVIDAVKAGDIQTLARIMHASSQAHPFFEGQPLGGLPTVSLFNEALDRTWAAITMDPDRMQDHVLSLSHCVQFGRCSQTAMDLPLVRKAAQTPEQQTQVQALALRMHEALTQGRVDAFLRCNLDPCPKP